MKRPLMEKSRVYRHVLPGYLRPPPSSRAVEEEEEEEEEELVARTGRVCAAYDALEEHSVT